MDKFEVSNQQYASCVNAGVCTEPGRKILLKEGLLLEIPSLKLSCNSGNLAASLSDYCHWIEELPTEAEWEKQQKDLMVRSIHEGNEFVPRT